MGGAWFLIKSQLQVDNLNEGNILVEINKAHTLFIEGKHDESIAAYESLIDSSNNADIVARLKGSQAYAIFYKPGHTPDEGAKAVNTLSEIVNNEQNSDLTRGWALTALLQFYYQSQHADVLAAIRNLDMFVGSEQNDTSELLERAARTADSWSPSTFSKIFIAVPLARAFITEADTLTADQRTLTAQEVEANISASYLYEPSQEVANDRFVSQIAEHYRAIVLSTIASAGVDPMLATNSFEVAIKIASESNGPYAKEWSIYTRFFYATHELDYGSLDKVNELVSELIAGYKNLPSDGELMFKTFAEASHMYPDSYNYKLFSELAGASTTFQQFLAGELNLVF